MLESVKSTLQQYSVLVNDDWLLGCLNYLSTKGQLPMNASDNVNSSSSSSTLHSKQIKKVAEQVFRIYLNIDIFDSVSANRETSPLYSLYAIENRHKVYFSPTLPVILQIMEILNIGASYEQIELNTGGHRFLKLALTDGHFFITALEMQIIDNLHLLMPAGAKVLIKNAFVRKGTLMLTPFNCKVFGGEVTELVDIQSQYVGAQQVQEYVQEVKDSGNDNSNNVQVYGARPIDSIQNRLSMAKDLNHAPMEDFDDKLLMAAVLAAESKNVDENEFINRRLPLAANKATSQSPVPPSQNYRNNNNVIEVNNDGTDVMHIADEKGPQEGATGKERMCDNFNMLDDDPNRQDYDADFDDAYQGSYEGKEGTKEEQMDVVDVSGDHKRGETKEKEKGKVTSQASTLSAASLFDDPVDELLPSPPSSQVTLDATHDPTNTIVGIVENKKEIERNGDSTSCSSSSSNGSPFRVKGLLRHLQDFHDFKKHANDNKTFEGILRGFCVGIKKFEVLPDSFVVRLILDDGHMKDESVYTTSAFCESFLNVKASQCYLELQQMNNSDAKLMKKELMMRFASLNGLFSAKLENFNYREKVALLTNKPVRKSSPKFDIVLYTRVDQRQDIIDLAQYHIQHIKHNKATNNK